SKEIRYRQSVSREGLLSKEERHNFSSMLSYLKKDGLIDKKEGKWRITKGGRDKLGKYVKKPRPNYPRTQSDNLKIIAFDIPEDKRNKRAWLRSALKNMGFKMIQQSMWAGKRNISRQFLDDLNRMEIIQYVDIFTVTKSGSLRSFKK
ncbi:CRISPR-associated endonuclease Cas2, partial [Patescibacteria group bacterium]|nr:CRISPR-associated endonuclease Cas2 [Patescibacteria group bacterium]